jgi:hypothetical protein
MRLIKNRRTLAAISFIWPALLCVGILVVDLSYGIYPSDLWAARSASRTLAATLFGVLFLSVVLLAALFSPIRLSRVIRLSLLFLCVSIGLACLFFAQILLLAWVFPLWYVFWLYRGPAA